ncbi:ChrR family anti-sigma-E factor [Cereibacter sphaeroides]|uniref:ChrR family anti-sigma-E factor n=1 Tax=Cereibacter sphaeroides TaxID=1063 RepID=UPI001F1983C8|nr:ChrR family anti-sigma-E factor [Cereibacter sphaeroides]MCE6951125.1 ChrR family anti-sigma-E factor [Cereibacter sphaeroides]
MTIRHHISDSLLLAHSSGNLPEAFGLVVATHISLCDECRARLAAFEAVGGSLMEDAAPVAMAAGSLAAVMSRLDRRIETPRPVRRLDPRAPAPLADYIGGSLDAVRWRPLGGGVRQAILPTGGEAIARLLWIPGGQSVPDHGHRGMELTLVLQGAFRDETDRFGPGDLEIADEEMEHTPVAEAGPDCICLAATDAPLRFNSLLPRLVQPFVRI